MVKWPERMCILAILYKLKIIHILQGITKYFSVYKLLNSIYE